ncbi:MAG: hypothetical protein LC792_00660, partial [Actinobacteria bacterium]|nr:hypothetical protein [Actinomycetota bacterium]
WYDGDNPLAFTDLITGAPKRTITQEENVALWHMSKKIRQSKQLSELFENHENADFFAQLENSDEGRELMAEYQCFIAQHGHRGHADRDIYYTRRSEDPAVDYRALQAILSTDATHDPEALEAKVNERREAVVADVIQNIGRKPLGTLRVELFKVLLNYTHRFLMDRDNERHWIDRTTFTMKRGFLEVAHRLIERGLLDDTDEVFFLTKEEAYDLLDGRGNLPLAKAKVGGRKKNFDLFHSKKQIPPLYLHRGRPAELDAAGEEAGDGVLRGIGTSRGSVTGTARIVRELKDIGRVRNREILVTNSTDPGWTPVFLVITSRRGR